MVRENIYSYLNVFGPNRKKLLLSDKTLCCMEGGHPCEGGIFSGGKRKFGQGDMCEGQ